METVHCTANTRLLTVPKERVSLALCTIKGLRATKKADKQHRVDTVLVTSGMMECVRDAAKSGAKRYKADLEQEKQKREEEMKPNGTLSNTNHDAVCCT